MKYIHDTALADITALLSDCPIWSSSTNSSAANSRNLHGRLEAYTTKRAGTDKKYALNVSDRYVAEQEAVVADDKLAALIRFQNDQIHPLAYTNNTNNHLTGRKRRSVSTGEVPCDLPKSSRLQLSSSLSTVVGRRDRANSLDIPRPIMDGCKTKDEHEDSSSLLFGAEITTSPSIPTQKPNFRALSLAAVNRRLLTDLILTLNHSFPDYDFATAGISDFAVCTVQTAVTRINERLGEYSASTSAMATPLLGSVSKSGGVGHSYQNGSNFLSTLWKAVDDVIHLSEVTEVYSYQPKNAEFDDPHSFLKNSLVKGGWDEYDVVGIGSSANASGANQSNEYGNVVHNDDDSNDYDEYDDSSDSFNKSQRAQKASVHREVLWTFNYFFVNKHAKRILLFTCIETMTRSEYLIPSTYPTNRKSSMVYNAIPEHEVVHHRLRRNDAMFSSTPESKRNRRRRRYKYVGVQLSSPSNLPSEDDVSGHDMNDDDECDDDDDDNDDDDEDDDDCHTIASSSAVSVDFDLDPANAVSGGIPIGH
jgi:Maf1 regulator